jgi:MFS family permease
MSKSAYGKTYTAMLLGILGFVLGTGILLFDTWLPSQNKAFIRSPEFVLWLGLIGILTTLLIIFPLGLVRDLKHLRPYYTSSKFEIGLSSFLFTMLYFLPFLMTALFFRQIEFGLIHFYVKTPVLYVIGLVTTVLPAAIGIWSVQVAARTANSNTKPHEKHIREHLRFQRLLRQFVLILGTVIGLAILATGASRGASIAAGVSPEDFPVILVLIYGAYFTLLIALVYFPASAALLQAGRRLLDAIFPMPSPDASSWADAYSKREDLAKLLSIRTTAEQRFQTNVVVLAPLLSAILSVLLEA